uniref:Uncharacterized protein n=1 Tax=Anopheles dirus TaxID=7168 RepID=A0A182NYX1_9DIPT
MKLLPSAEPGERRCFITVLLW